MSHCLLTYDRGDRNQMYDHCLNQVARFHGSYNEHIQVIYPPKNGAPDLSERVHLGYQLAKGAGYDWVIIIESDDFYAPHYLHEVLKKVDQSDFIGSEFSFYYNIATRRYERLMHPNHSSLFTTAFRVSAMDKFKWNLAHRLFLDIDIWKYARKNNYRRTFVELPAMGIKGHGFGITGGKGHTMKLKNADPDMKWLEARVDKESMEFYKSLCV